MDRYYKLLNFFEMEAENRITIEPPERLQEIMTRIREAVSLTNPSVIVKAGLGNSDLLPQIAESAPSRLCVVEPSHKNAAAFMKNNSTEPWFEKLDFIAGEFNLFPVDYYTVDLLISIDNLGFLESARAVDEFKRAIQFEKHLLIATPVVAAADFDGVYDELIRAACSLHTDYYMEVDLKTFIELNDFKFIKGSSMTFRRSLKEILARLAEFEPENSEAARNYLKENEEVFREHYNYDGDMFDEPWYCGLFMKEKYRETEPTILDQVKK
jgi:hypothetical protein